MILAKAPFLLSAFLLVQYAASDVGRLVYDACGGCVIYANGLDDTYGNNVPPLNVVAQDLAHTCDNPHEEVVKFCEVIRGKEFSFGTEYVSVRPQNPGSRACRNVHVCQ